MTEVLRLPDRGAVVSSRVPLPADRRAALDAERAAITAGMVDTFVATLKSAADQAADLATDTACQPGVRDIAARMSEDIYSKIQTLVALRGRR